MITVGGMTYYRRQGHLGWWFNGYRDQPNRLVLITLSEALDEIEKLRVVVSSHEDRNERLQKVIVNKNRDIEDLDAALDSVTKRLNQTQAALTMTRHELAHAVLRGLP